MRKFTVQPDNGWTSVQITGSNCASALYANIRPVTMQSPDLTELGCDTFSKFSDQSPVYVRRNSACAYV